MRATPVRWLFGLAIFAIASMLALLAPAQAYAGTCYTVTVGSDGTTICPWQ